jgi:hypothetical protein
VAPSVAAVASASAIAPTAPPARPAITPGAANRGVEDGWSRLRLRMQERPALAAALDHAAVDAWEAGKVVLSFADRLPLEATEKGRKLIEAALVDLCGAPTTLHLKMGTGANAPVVRAETVQQAESQASDRQRREEEARKHPMIRKAEEVFGIAAREIKVS